MSRGVAKAARLPWEDAPDDVSDAIATIRHWQRAGVSPAEALLALRPGRRVACASTWRNVMDLILAHQRSARGDNG